MKAEVDHLVGAARTLGEGARWCEAAQGITPGPGGKRPLINFVARVPALHAALATLCGGALQTLIEWSGRHPVASMPASGVTLGRHSKSALTRRATPSH